MYIFKSRVRYSEVTKEQTLDLYAVLNYFQDCSNFQSTDLGVGVQYLTERRRVWLLSAWQVDIFRLPRLFDEISVGTWPYDFKGIYGYRNFVLYNETRGHEVAACANSIWFLADTTSGRPLRITVQDAAPYMLEPAHPMEYAPRKIHLPECAADMQNPCDPAVCDCPPITVTKMLLDTNNHVNNSQYIRLAQGCLPETFLPELSHLRRMRAEYRHSAVLGDVIHPRRILCNDAKHCYICLNDTDENAYAVVEFTADGGIPV